MAFPPSRSKSDRKKPGETGQISDALLRWLYGYDVFISYRRSPEGRDFVAALAAHLATAKIAPFVDDNALELGDDLPSSLRGHIARSRVYLVLIDDRVLESKWVPREYEFAKASKRVIVPIDVDGAIARLSDPQKWDAGLPQWPFWNELVDLKNLSIANLGTDDQNISSACETIQQSIGKKTVRCRAKAAFLTAGVLTALVIGTLIFFAGNASAARRRSEAIAKRTGWEGRAKTAEGELRYDLAEFDLARAAEEDPDDADNLLSDYRRARSNRWLAPLNLLKEDRQERLAYLAEFRGQPVAVIHDDAERLRVVYSGKSVPLVEPGPASRQIATVMGEGQYVLWVKGRRAFCVDVTHPENLQALDLGFEPEKSGVAGGQLFALESNANGSKLHRFEIPKLTAVEPTVLQRAPEGGAYSLTPSGETVVLNAKLSEGHLTLLRWKPDGSAIQNDYEDPLASPGHYTHVLDAKAEPSANRILLTVDVSPLSGSGILKWVQIDLRDPRAVRVLDMPPRDGFETPPLDRATYVVGLTPEGDVRFVPEVSPVVTEARAVTIARGAKAFRWWPLATSPRQLLILIADEKSLTLYDRDVAVTRYPLGLTEPIHVWTTSEGGFIAVEGDEGIRLWRTQDRSLPVKSFPKSNEIAKELALTERTD